MNEAYGVEMEVGPIILGRRPTSLDAVFGSRLVEEYRSQGMDVVSAIEQAHRTIPLDFCHGVYAGSSALIPNCTTRTTTYISSFQRHISQMDDARELIRPNEIKRKGGRLFDGLGTPEMNQYEVYNVDEPGMVIQFFAKGDRAVAERLLDLDEMEYFGKKRYGKIKDIRFITMDDYPNFGIIARNGTVLRPVQKSALDDAGIKPRNYAMAYEAILPPYWKTSKHLCYVPPHRMWPVSVLSELHEES